MDTKGKGKRTVILGASPNPARYAYLAATRLKETGHDFIPVGIKKGRVAGMEILDIRQRPAVEAVDTITLYMNPAHQQLFYDYIISLQPKRIIFNPGTENPDLAGLSRQSGIQSVFNCTLIMLSSGIY